MLQGSNQSKLFQNNSVYFFFIFNYYNLSSSCCTQNYNGQHLISTMFLCSSIYNLLHYHKNLKLSYPLVALKASLESGPTYYRSLFISHDYLTYSLGCVSAVPIHTNFSQPTLILHIQKTIYFASTLYKYCFFDIKVQSHLLNKAKFAMLT